MWHKYTAKWGVQMPGMNFQTRSSVLSRLYSGSAIAGGDHFLRTGKYTSVSQSSGDSELNCVLMYRSNGAPAYS
ncbi:DUF6783 domain-containing protein [Otoolea muris]|uniref:DUF6783 domain-containing protein n=1 Tax=Otoolea muris TaxID=2941515 RepID=UPI003A7F26A2